MLRIAICDDMIDQLQLYEHYTKRYLKTKGYETAQITCFENPLDLVESIEKNGGFDIVLLDICMPGLNGTAVAKIIRERKDKTEIIFLTTSDEFAVEAFHLKAAHYLLKPFPEKLFVEAMDRAVERFVFIQPIRIVMKLSGGGLQTVDLNEILCVESFNHEQQVLLKNQKTLKVRESLSSVLAQLEELTPGQFLSPYKGYIVNLKAVLSIEPKCITLLGGKKIPIVRRNYRALSERYFDYTFDKKKK